MNPTQADIIDRMVEVSLDRNEDFLKVRETLTRIGIASRKDNTLYQSCHILHKQGRYYIVHFKELFALDGKIADMSPEDYGRRNTIVHLLDEWGLVKIINPELAESPTANLNTIKVLPFKEKHLWTLTKKYNIGRKR